MTVLGKASANHTSWKRILAIPPSATQITIDATDRLHREGVLLKNHHSIFGKAHSILPRFARLLSYKVLLFERR
jgi:hypothetical protein